MIRQFSKSSLIRQRKVSQNPSNRDREETLGVDIESSGSNSSSNDVEIVVVKERDGDNHRDSPPSDDVCPICFGEFSVPVKTNCGHWFCGGCFLQLWNHKPSLRKCKCPMCSQLISKLTPEACLLRRHEKEVCDVLKNVQKYNSLFQGGFRGLIQNIFSFPLLTKRLLQGLMDPDRFTINYETARCIGVKNKMVHLTTRSNPRRLGSDDLLMLGLMYQISPLDFIPTERHVAHSFFELCATSLVFLFCLVGICRRALLVHRTRRIAAAFD